MRPALTHRPFLLLGAIAVVAYVALGDGSASSGLYLAFGWSACAALVAGTLVYRPPAAAAWWLLALSQALWAGADSLWFLTADADGVAPVYVDVPYLAGYVVIAGALLLLRPPGRRSEAGDLINATIVAIAVAVLAWPLVFEPGLATAGSLATVIAMAYPVLDVFLLALLFRLLVHRGTHNVSVILVGASVSLVLVSDLVYATPALDALLDVGALRDLGWLAGYVLIGAAGLHRHIGARAVSAPEKAGRPVTQVAVLALALLSVPVAALVDFSIGSFGVQDAIPFLGAAAALVILVSARFGLLLSQVERLRRQAAGSERKLRSVFDAAGVGIAIGADGYMTETNAAVQRMLGYSGEELAAKHYLELTHPADRDQDVRRSEDVYSGEAPAYNTEKRYLRSDGSVLWANVTVTMAPEGDFGISVIEDVTARRDLEEQLRQAQKMEAVGQLAGGVAHDFNNLLMAISGYAELALRRLPEDDRTRSDVLQILGASERAARLTQQLLAFSRRQVLKQEVVDLDRAVTSATTLLDRLLGSELELGLELSGGLPPVVADPAQLEQIVVNLSVNARDAMPGGGRLTLATRQVELDGDEAAALELAPGRYAVLEVADTGTGMDEATCGHAFEPFFTTKGPGKGSGLGLSMVYGAVRQTGGAAEIESELGVGTTVRVYLPFAAADAVLPEPGLRTLAPAGGRPSAGSRVLLVDDEPAVGAVVQEALESQGFEVVNATDPLDALTLVDDSEPFDLVVTDLVMPVLDGRRLAEEIRTRYPDIPVLFMSGYAGAEVIARGLLTADTPFIEKPFALADLRARVSALLPARPLLRVTG